MDDIDRLRKDLRQLQAIIDYYSVESRQGDMFEMTGYHSLQEMQDKKKTIDYLLSYL